MFNVKTGFKTLSLVISFFSFMSNVKSKRQKLSLTLKKGTFFRTFAQRRKYNLKKSFSAKRMPLSVVARDA